jgi:predicted lipid-binding transport protein (Tim44 family)
MRRSSSFIAAVAVAALALAPSFADARAGAGSSMGSRGARTYSAPPTTNTSPFQASPLDRSMTARPAPNPGYGAPAAPAFGGRSAFGSGLLGGLLGVGLGSMLFGGGLFGGSGGLGGLGFIGLLLQAALLFFVGRWLFRMFMRRQQPAMAGGPSFARMQQPGAAPGLMPGGGARPAPSVQIGKPDYEAFDRTLHEVQAAWSAQDLNALRGLATPEMVGYFGEQLAEQASRGVRNTVTHVKLEQGDLAEAWSEGGREYATVAMRFSSLDVTRDATGRVVEGDVALRSMATELWTFVRTPGGRWLLSAIQQAR